MSLSRLVFRAGCGIRLYRFLIIAFLSTLEGNGNKLVVFFISLCCCLGLHPFLLDAVSNYDLFSLANVYRGYVIKTCTDFV